MPDLDAYLDDLVEEGKRRLPTRWEVCYACEGRGSSSAYLGAFTREDFDDDPEFAEDYFAGTYDRTCETCRGRTTVSVIAEDRLTPEELADYHNWQEQMASLYEMEAAERRAGC